MRHYVFYLAIAFTAFCLGILTFVSFNLWKVGKLESEGFEKMKSAELLRKSSEVTKPAKRNFKCESEFLSAVWNGLRKDQDYRELFTKEIEDCSEILGVGDTIDLNNDDKKDVAVVTDNGWLNGVFNQSFWLVWQDGDDYKIILEGKNVEYDIENHTTNGFRDLVTDFEVSIEEYKKSLWKFDGKSYRQNKCWNEIIAVRNKNDQIIKLETPRKIPTVCGNQ